MWIFEQRIFDWLKRRESDRRLRRWGNLMACPWCRCDIQTGEEWGISAWDRDDFIDVATCGQCAGTSLWRFEIGFFYIGALNPPLPKHIPWKGYSVEDARLVGASK